MHSIRSHYGFFLSFLAIVALGIFYEWLRASARTFDRRVALKFVDGKGKGRVSRHLHHNEAAVSPSHPDHSLEEEGGGDGDGELAGERTVLLTGYSNAYKNSST